MASEVAFWKPRKFVHCFKAWLLLSLCSYEFVFGLPPIPQKWSLDESKANEASPIQIEEEMATKAQAPILRPQQQEHTHVEASISVETPADADHVATVFAVAEPAHVIDEGSTDVQHSSSIGVVSLPSSLIDVSRDRLSQDRKTHEVHNVVEKEQAGGIGTIHEGTVDVGASMDAGSVHLEAPIDLGTDVAKSATSLGDRSIRPTVGVVMEEGSAPKSEKSSLLQFGHVEEERSFDTFEHRDVAVNSQQIPSSQIAANQSRDLPSHLPNINATVASGRPQRPAVSPGNVPEHEIEHPLSLSENSNGQSPIEGSIDTDQMSHHTAFEASTFLPPSAAPDKIFSRSGRQHFSMPPRVDTAPQNFVAENSSVAKDSNAKTPIGPAEEASILTGLFFRHSPFLWAFVIMLAASLSGTLCLVAGFCVSSALWHRANSGAIRTYVERLPVCKPNEIEQRLPVRGGYDCTFSKPLSSQQLLRIEAYVQDPHVGELLTAPLTLHKCVLYSTVVSRKVHDGVHPIPVAFACASVNFSVALADNPNIRVDIRGKDVSLFDMCDGRSVDRRSRAIPDHWQDFIASNQTAPHLVGSPINSDGFLEFQECTLLVGSLVTLVGELHRGTDGALALRPWPGDAPSFSSLPREKWRTSWEGGEFAGDTPGPDNSISSIPSTSPAEPWADSLSEARIEKVLVSDDPKLFKKGGLTSMAPPIPHAALRKCCGPWGAKFFLQDK